MIFNVIIVDEAFKDIELKKGRSKMKYEIFLSEGAEKDLISIFEYVYYNDSSEKAEYVYSGIKERILNLSFNPFRIPF